NLMARGAPLKLSFQVRPQLPVGQPVRESEPVERSERFDLDESARLAAAEDFKKHFADSSLRFQ
ncbi:MAG: hypothetical protein ACSLFQ_00095, partial [Thermoanaerobaculia bacterium]